jgi:hypothetical protein
MAYSKYVEEIQQSLNDQYHDHPHYPLAVDGLIGPKTCGALYKLQKEWLGNDSSTIAFDTLKTLDTGFTAQHLTAVQNKCKPYWKGAGEATGVVDEGGSGTVISDPEEPVIVGSRTSSWPFILIGGGLGGLGGYYAHKKGLVKVGSAPVISGAGAGLGALIFHLVSKKKSG